MHTDPATYPDDDNTAAAPPETSTRSSAQEDVPTEARDPAGPPDAYKRRHLGREAMDRWMLHQTFMADLAADEEAESASNLPSLPSAPDDQPGQRSP